MDEILDEGIFLPKAPSIENAKQIIKLKANYTKLHKKVKNGRIALYVLLGFSIIGAVVETVQLDFEPIALGVSAVYVSLLVISAIVAIKKPYIGFALAIGVLIILSLLAMLGDPMSLIKGIFMRVIIVYYLIVGLGAVKAYLNTLRDLKAHDIILDGSELV